MKSYSITELFGMTRNELFALDTRIFAKIADLPEADSSRAIGFANLRLIRRVLAHPRLAP